MADQMSKANVKALAEKVEAFVQTLTPEERTLLGISLARASGREPDVQGYTVVELDPIIAIFSVLIRW